MNYNIIYLYVLLQKENTEYRFYVDVKDVIIQAQRSRNLAGVYMKYPKHQRGYNSETT